MPRNNLYVICVAVFVILFTFHTAHAQKIYGADARQNQREIIDETNVSATNKLSTISPDQFPVFPLKLEQPIRRVVVGDDSGSVSANVEKIVYSNRLGITIAQIPAQMLVADDLSLNASFGCELSRFTFQVVGRANPDDIGGPFRVDYALYQYCPNVGGPIIPQTQGFVDIPEDQQNAIQPK